LGTHTHVPTLDTRVLPKGTAYVSDVGMTGPSGGMQGLHPRSATPWMGNRLPTKGKLELVGMCSLAIRRLFPNSKLALIRSWDTYALWPLEKGRWFPV